MRYLLRLSYDGGPFHGFAANVDVPTIGGVLRGALEKVLQQPVPISCAGRTDAGVHALDQVVTFTTDRGLEPGALRGSLNSLCKPHIVVSEVRQVADDFDARFSCTGRTYRYRILNRRLPDPFRLAHTWRVSRTLDIEAMQAAGSYLVGTHDFSSFCRRQFETRGEAPVEKSRTRTLRVVEWASMPDDEVHLIISASAFCHQMVRSIAGLCVDVGLGQTAAAEVPDILVSLDRGRVPVVAPPHGLFLLKVDYD